MRAIEHLHDQYALGRRVRVLAGHIARLLPAGATVLDVGAGDGLLAAELLRSRPDISISGVDVQVRPEAAIRIRAFDGRQLPFADASFDAVILVDVVHHADEPTLLLQEAVRVARGPVVIKDHASDRFLGSLTLRFMDRVGNARHGVALPYRYWRRQTWLDTFGSLGRTVTFWQNDLGLYPGPAKWIFGGSLHFLARISTP